MAPQTGYVICGGTAGRERLRVLARTLHTSTNALFERLGVGTGLHCLDAGCGGGNVTFELARLVGPHGRVLGVDRDAVKIDLARHEAAAMGLGNAEFRVLDIGQEDFGTGFDLVYARFLLSHLPDPAATLAAFGRALRPGGLLVVEDIDFNGSFAWPITVAFQRYCALYRTVVRARGGDPDIGPRLPLLVAEGGFEQVDLHVVQPTAMRGEVKLINPLTLQNIADAIVQDRLATRAGVDALVQELYAFAADPRSLAGLARGSSLGSSARRLSEEDI